MTNTAAALASIVIVALLIIYVVAGTYMEHRHCPFGHETGIAIILGFLISMTAYLVGKEEFVDGWSFSGDIFFYLCLPPIIFTSGFNMRRKRFFENIGYISLFGLLGTVITFLLFTLLTWGFIQTGMMYKYQHGKE